VAGRRKQWLLHIVVFTGAGIISSGAVGAIVGSLGRWLGFGGSTEIARLSVVMVGIAALVRELVDNRIPLPQIRRQTNGSWARQFPSLVAAAGWGSDLGATFTTWLTFAGIWVLTVGLIFIGDPLYGSAAFVFYWLGRALSVWIAPFLLRNASGAPQLLSGLMQEARLLQFVHAAGIAGATAIIAVWLV